MTPSQPQAEVLVTRPLPDAIGTAAAVRARGFGPVLAPMLAIVPRPAETVLAQAAIIASRNAARAMPPFEGPVLAVGDATAAEARARGLDAESAGGDATDLIALAARRLDPARGPLLLLTGARQGQALAAGLRGHGFRVIRRVGYDAQPAAALPREAASALAARRIRYVLLFSAATASAFVRVTADAGLGPALETCVGVAIGQPAAESAHSLPWLALRVARRPTEDAMLDELR